MFGVLYQLQLRRDHLLQLCAGWQKPLESLNTGTTPLEPWGPSDAELLAARIDAVVASTMQWEEEEDSGSENDLELEDEEVEDAGLAEALELMELSDGFRDCYGEMM